MSNISAKILGWLILLLLAGPASANDRIAAVRYDLSVWGFRIATIEDSVSISVDNNYVIHSNLNFIGVLKWLGLGGIERKSSGYIDYENTRIYVLRYFQKSYGESIGFNIDLKNDIIEQKYEEIVTVVSMPGDAKQYPIYDSLVLAYNYYLLDGRASDIEKYIFMDGKRSRMYEFLRMARDEKILYDGSLYDTIRYDRHKRGELHTTILYVPEFRWLPGFAEIHLAKNLAIQIQLVDHAITPL